MTAQRWARLQELFAAAVERGSGVETEALYELCGQDPELARDLIALVREHFALEQRELPSRASLPVDVPASARARFRFLSRLGSGTFGDVYKVEDLQRGTTVALKILRESKPSALLYFKREFRTMAGLEHPNLVRLYELIAEDARWMFTMEFLEGTDFRQYIAAGDREARIRGCLPQLAAAVAELHRRGLLHRDLKPSNVIVTTGGRVCVLDFGLVRGFGDEAPAQLTIAGTPDFMSPEQAAGAPLTEASDWYSIGVMLYEALTGMLPFKGPAFDILRRKQVEPPPLPSAIDPQIPADLSELCQRLLQLDPAERLTAAASIQALSSPAKTGITHASSVIGRDDELHMLQDAYFQCLEGRCVIAHVFGPSGIGKSVLVREFLHRLRTSDPDSLAFFGRCYQSEAVPFQGLDDLVDHIAHYLERLPAGEQGQFLPRNPAVIARMFPVFGSLPKPERVAAVPLDSAELRSQAFSALRELLGRIGDRRRMVLVIDDLQWGGLDTSAFLRELTAYSDAPRLLLILCYRSEDIAELPWLQQLQAGAGEPAKFARHVLMRLGCLSSESAAQLAEMLAAGRHQLSGAAVQDLVDQSGGDPFLVHEGVQWMLDGKASGLAAASFDVEAALKDRIAILSSTDRRVLEFVAVAGQPIAADIIRQLISSEEFSRACDRLLTRRLLRLRNVEGTNELEVYHDRIRSAALGLLEPAKVPAYHADLAQALEQGGTADAEKLAHHYFQGGDLNRAAVNALRAGQGAFEGLAFNKAAYFFQLALQTKAIGKAEQEPVYRHLGDALANAGRGSEAGEAYLMGAELQSGLERLRSHALAAAQFLRCGYVLRGKQLLRNVLREVGIRTPETRGLQLLWIVALRARIRLRGLRYTERQASELSPEQLLRVDLCGSAALGLSMTDPLASAGFSARFVLLALNAGEPYRAALALAGEATQVSHTGGERNYARARVLLDRALRIAAELNNPHAHAFTILMSGVVSYLEGSWKRCSEEFVTAQGLLRSRCTGTWWELSTANSFLFVARGIRGEWSENRRALPMVIREAETRGDLYASISLRILGCAYILDLADDKPEAARRRLDEDIDAWPTDKYDIQRANALVVRIDISLYCEEPERGWQYLETEWKPLQRSGIMSLPTSFTFSHCSRGRIALAMACKAALAGKESASYVREARRSAQKLLRNGPPWAGGLAHLLLAGAATFDAPQQTLGELRTAVALLDRSDLGPFRFAARHRLAQLVDTDEASALRRVVEDWAAEQSIVNPTRILNGLSTGLWPKGDQP